jgi:hypothetical protein
MKRRRKLLSILLSLALAVGMIPAFTVPAQAASPMPNFKITSEGVISWDHVSGADHYYIHGLDDTIAVLNIADDGYNFNDSMTWTAKGVTFDLKKYMDYLGYYEEKNYALTVYPLKGTSVLDYRSECQYSYVSSIPKLEKPANLRWNGTTISWDPVPNAVEYFFVMWDSLGDKSVWSSFTNDSSVDLTTHKSTHPISKGTLMTFEDQVQYYFAVRAIPEKYSGGGATARESDWSQSETVSGATIKAGYRTGDSYSVRISGGTADKTKAKYGEKITLTAIPNNSDFTFDKWTAVKGSVSFAGQNSSTTTFAMPAGEAAVCGNYKVNAGSGSNSWSGKTNPFVDVSKGTYYYDPVLWAYYASPQVTNGIDTTHFGPMSTVTRGQCVTFLWRAMGCPEPANKTNPFVDVPEKEYYYKPILWAVEKGITKGTDVNHFTPNQKLSTAHIVTFLYRTLEKGTDGWYEEAGNWAKGDGLLDGTGLGVSDQTDCPRGAVVTFLCRELADTVSGANQLSQDDFLIYVEEYYNITGRGRVISGRVVNGSIKVGDKVTLISCNESTDTPERTNYTVLGIEMFHKTLDEAQKGDNVGIFLSTDTGIKTPTGSALVNEGSSLKSSPGRFVGTMKLNNNTGTKTLTLGDTFQVYWAGYDVTAMLVDLNGSDLKPNTTREGVKLTLSSPAVFYVGQELTIREGGRTYGTFTVTGIQ